MSDQDIQSMDDDPFSESDILCPHSDLFLLVGPNKLPIGVDARSLRRVSKVFEAMFKPPWLESTKLSENRISPPELALPEDDFRAMIVICCIIHHRNDLVPSDISASDILQVAIVADKYDMLTAFKYAAAAWLKMRPEAGTPEAESILFMGNLLAAAYLFRDPEQFQAIAFRLIFDYFGTYREVARNPRIVEVLGPEAPVMLEERRTRIKAELLQQLHDDVKKTCEGVYGGCGYGRLQKVQYTSLLSSYTPMGLVRSTINDLIGLVRDSNPSAADAEKDLAPRGQPRCNSGLCVIDGRNNFTNKVDELEKRWVLSYDTVRADQAAAAKQE